ncbi:YfhD family protein [Anaerobacillus sp. MEB173]|uniref:YfhD family protein n=1 Tax=Anaerobacillus sp. MEB173 TaxID=3383345 RepID=UPI003F903045
MSRARTRKARDKNEAKLPQTPKKDIATANDDIEIAQEVSEQYDLEVKPGFQPTAAKRKNNS